MARRRAGGCAADGGIGVPSVLVFALAVPPVVKIYRLIENRRKPLWIAGLLFAPCLAVGAVVFGVLQTMVLKNGILDDYWILGSPIIVTMWLFVSAGVFAIFGKHIVTVLTTPRMSEGAQAIR